MDPNTLQNKMKDPAFRRFMDHSASLYEEDVGNWNLARFNMLSLKCGISLYNPCPKICLGKFLQS